MDEESITDDVMQMVDSGGLPVPVSVGYDGVTHRAAAYLREALEGEMTYTVTVAATVKDLAGNEMGAPYSWSFVTQKQARRIHLPIILRSY